MTAPKVQQVSDTQVEQAVDSKQSRAARASRRKAIVKPVGKATMSTKENAKPVQETDEAPQKPKSRRVEKRSLADVDNCPHKAAKKANTASSQAAGRVPSRSTRGESAVKAEPVEIVLRGKKASQKSDTKKSTVEPEKPLEILSRQLKERDDFWQKTFLVEVPPPMRESFKSGKITFFYTDALLNNFVRQARSNIAHEGYMKAMQLSSAKPINGTFRHILVSWMMSMYRVLHYTLSRQTLHLAISLLDRYFTQMLTVPAPSCVPVGHSVECADLLVVASSCFYLASKLEDERPVDIEDCAEQCSTQNIECVRSDIVTSDILKWELTVLKVLDFCVNVPTVLDFLAIFVQSDSRLMSQDPSCPAKNDGYESCAIYLSELTLLFPEAVELPTHVIAAVALCCAITYIDDKPRRITNLPVPVLSWLEVERNNGVLRQGAAKIATILDVHAEGSTNNNAKEVDKRYKETSTFFLDKYRRWKSERSGQPSEQVSAV